MTPQCDFKRTKDGNVACVICHRPLRLPKTFNQRIDRIFRNCKGITGVIGPGPGTYLSRLLKKFGISPSPTCKCRQIAKRMDQGGPDWCEQNKDRIVEAMRSEAKKRGWMFFSATIAKKLVEYAIRRARKAPG